MIVVLFLHTFVSQFQYLQVLLWFHANRVVIDNDYDQINNYYRLQSG